MFFLNKVKLIYIAITNVVALQPLFDIIFKTNKKLKNSD